MTADLLLSKAIEGFLIARRADGYAPQTLEQYQWALKMLLEFGDLPLSRIDTPHLRNFMASIQHRPNLSATSAFHVWKSLRAFFKWLSAEGLTGRPDHGLTKPKYAHREIKPLTEEEIRALIKAAEYTKITEGRRKPFRMKRPTAERDKALLLILLDTGIRASELCRLEPSDVDLKNSTITIRPHRSGLKSRARIIPIGQSTRKALWRYIAKYDPPEGKPLFNMDRTSLTRLVVRMGDRAGVHGVHPHRFRHTFAIQYLRNGGDVFTLQRILGHSTLSMVQHYLALADADAQTAHRKASPADNWKL
ncbi:MAG: tyrosine-type recombinase/integrase [Candidatus Methanomethylicaceae archaeon]